LIDYPKTASDLEVIKQVIVDIARGPKKPVFLEKPVYPASEVSTLLRIIKDVRAERPDLPLGYKLVFDDLEQRIQTDQSRATLNVAASAMIALATPRFSAPMLELFVIPAYQKANKPEIVRALSEEAARWAR
jgi:hypothetical protein